MLFLRKTAFLVLCNRYHAEFLKLQIENTFDDKFWQPSGDIDLN